MIKVSWAQNNEDIMLWRALKDIKNGFYIDVGANDPVEDSVTKLFYDMGWSGINLEPLSVHINELKAQRPKDINLELAASNTEGAIKIWEPEIRGWATMDESTALKHERDGVTGVWKTVTSITLNEVCRKHVRSDIHFLKIDVEGAEQTVLEGLDLNLWRPWIIVVEATKPGTATLVHESWEPLIVDCKYTFVYTDGINRYYLAQEHASLEQFFVYGPNILDEYISFGQQKESERVNQLSALNNVQKNQLESQQRHLETQQTQLETQQRHIETQQKHIDAIETKNEKMTEELSQLNYKIDGLVSQHLVYQNSITEKDALINNLNNINSEVNTLLDIKLTQIANMYKEIDSLHNHLSFLDKTLENTHAELQSVLKSFSWKITAPARWFMKLIKKVIKKSFILFLKILGKPLYKIKPIRLVLSKMLNKHPVLFDKVRRKVNPDGYFMESVNISNIEDLNPQELVWYQRIDKN